MLTWKEVFFTSMGIDPKNTTTIKNKMEGLATESEPNNEAMICILVIGRKAIIAYQLYSVIVLIRFLFKIHIPVIEYSLC